MMFNRNHGIYLGLITLIASLASCGKSDYVQQPLPTDAPTLALISKGKQLVITNCYSCHSTDAPLEGGRLAPPMEAVKNHYLAAETTIEEFTANLVRFVQKPSPAYSKMPGARKRFGLMPALPLPDEELQAIAAFIYYTELEAPEWLEEHQKGERKEHEMLESQNNYAEKGKQLALQTKAILSKNLMAALNTGGPVHAIDFCNTRAIPLTDSSARVSGVQIHRVSDRPRNPDNAADSLQRIQLAEIQSDLDQGITEAHRLVVEENFVTGYYPIMINGMCLQCHGEKGNQVQPATLSALEALYPEDEAIGYTSSQLRGMWVVSMPKK